MPEQISKYPDVTLKVLEGAGALCGQDAPQKILTQCPAKRFCSLSTGEICVYGINDIPQMTQIKPEEIARVVCSSAGRDSAVPATISGAEGLSFVVVFFVGLGLGWLWKMFRVRASRPDD